MDKILLITQDASTAQLFTDELTSFGIELVRVSAVREGIKALDTEDYAAVLFDLCLHNGLNTSVEETDNIWLHHHQRPLTPVAALSWYNTDNERLDALYLGADMYLARPFHVKELMLNLARFTRRVSHTYHGDRDADGNGIGFNDSLCKVTALRREVVLTKTEFRLFKYIFERHGEVVSKDELQQQVLNKPLGRFDRNLDMHISNTRKKLAQTCLPREWINTVRGQGYRFSGNRG